LSFGYRFSPLPYAPAPVISRALLIIVALMRAADGVNAFPAFFEPVGYQPSM